MFKNLLNPFNRVTETESNYFDVLRGGSSLVVFIHHIFIIIWEPHIGKAVFNGLLTESSTAAAALAVMIFFVLSGFMITFSIYNNLSKNQFTDFDYLKYIKDRLYRLHPPLLFSMLIVIFVYYFIYLFELHGFKTFFIEGDYFQKIDNITLSLKGVASNAFYLQNLDASLPFLEMNTPLWSLSFEFWYYVLALFLTLSLFSNFKLLFISLFIALLLFMSTLSNSFYFAAGAIIWFSGAFLAILYQSSYLTSRVTKTFSIIALIFFFLLTCYCFIADSQSIFYHLKTHIAGLTFVSYLSVLFSHSQVRLKMNTRIRFYISSAKYSYSLYIIHWPLLILTNSLFHNLFHDSVLIRTIVTILSFIFIIKISSFSANIFEDRNKIKSMLGTN